MAKLSEIHKLIGDYLQLHGDKDVISIGTWGGATPYEYTFHLHDVHEGGRGTCTGSDQLDIPRYPSSKEGV